MAITVADTDVLIDFLHGRPSEHVQEELAGGTLASTSITEFELLSGAVGRARQQIETLLAAIDILPFDSGAAGTAAEVRHKLEQAGQPIGTADYLIAGICLSRGAWLLTRNDRHFARVPGLRLVHRA